MTDDDLKKIRNLVREELEPIKQVQKQHSNTLKDHMGILKNHTSILKQHSKQLGDLSNTLDTHSSILDTHSSKLDALTADMMEVQKKVGSTYDLAKATFESNKREIDEINEHLHLPITPSPFESA